MTSEWSRRVGLCLVQCVLLLWCSFAQAAGSLPLWEVRGQQGTVYLFGSVHVCRDTCYPLPASVLKRIDASATVALELDPQNPALVTELLQAAMLPAGERLQDKLPPALAREMESALQTIGLPLEAVSRFKPWMAGTLMTVAAAQAHGLSPDLGIDAWIADRARAQGKSIVELETVQRQLAALSQGTQREQIEDLRQVIALVRSNRMHNFFEEMIAAWRSGDAAKIDALVRESDGGRAGWRVEMLDRRNAEMAVRIEVLLAKPGSHFVVVGAAHLAGDHNIGDLLKRKGYAVRQVREGE